MKGHKLLLYVIGAIVAILAVVTAIVIFRNEIAYLFSELKDKIDEKRHRHNGEYADYADV